MAIYKKKGKKQTRYEECTVPVMPSREIEEDNEVYFEKLRVSNFFTEEEIGILKLIRSRDQFEEHCRLRGYAFQTAMF